MADEVGGDQREIRIAKLAKLREAGINPYPERFERTHALAAAKQLPADTAGVRIAGRIMTMRVMGKLSFATLLDETGRLQISVAQDDVTEPFYKDVWKKLVDMMMDLQRDIQQRKG